jgi:hypothetical protein
VISRLRNDEPKNSRRRREKDWDRMSFGWLLERAERGKMELR